MEINYIYNIVKVIKNNWNIIALRGEVAGS